MKLERVFLMMLIEKLSLKQVEYKPFNEVCEYIRGITYNKSQEAKEENEKNWKVLRANNIDLQRKVLDLRDVKEVDSSVKVKESQRLRKNDILICAGSGSKEHIGKVAFITEDMDYTFGGFMAVIRVISEKINSRFLFHILAGNLFSEFLAKKLNVSTINNLNSSLIKNFQIPLPPLPIQQEIVRILDTFTNLMAELTAELTARRKQYEYYRDELLTFGEDVPRMTLKDISVSVSSGKNKEKEQEGMYPVYGSTGVIGRTNTAKYSKEQILVARVGANAGFVHKANGTYDVSDNTIIVELKDNYNLQYVYYILQKMNLRKYAKGGGQPLVTAGELKKIEIPIPDINEQDRVVSILDKFTGISTSFDSGLPAEIAARQKQYEYYRERLLSFKESHR